MAQNTALSRTNPERLPIRFSPPLGIRLWLPRGVWLEMLPEHARHIPNQNITVVVVLGPLVLLVLGDDAEDVFTGRGMDKNNFRFRCVHGSVLASNMNGRGNLGKRFTISIRFRQGAVHLLVCVGTHSPSFADQGNHFCHVPRGGMPQPYFSRIACRP